MRRKRLFIGSSKEELPLADLASKILATDFDVSVWNDKIWDSSVFKINQSFLNDLLKASLRFDYGILLGTADDKVIYRGKEYLTPRDNVLFELGLFMGRLGISKCAFVVEKDLKIFTDIAGISLAMFERGNQKSFEYAILGVREFFLHSSDSELNFFPSSTLAAVYFENFVKPTCVSIIRGKGFQVNETIHSQCIVNIIIPNKLETDVNLQMEKYKKEYQTKNVSFNYDGRPRQITIESEVTSSNLNLYDFPTVLSGINYSIANLLPAEFASRDAEYESILSRELDRFVTTLLSLIKRDGFEELVCIVRK